ncbi:hypothetical protein NAB35_00080 [Proteus mirabilis]|nr:hypothetical protein [Proteus mirabilis]
MEDLIKYLPQYAALLTAGVATLLFIVKEIIEIIKKRRSDRRKLVSICLLFLNEIKANKDAINNTKKISDNIIARKCESWTVEYMSGNTFVTMVLNDVQKAVLAAYAKTTFFEKHILELASLNIELFNKVTSILILLDRYDTELTKTIISLYKNDMEHIDIMINYFKWLNKNSYAEYISALDEMEKLCEKLGKNSRKSLMN